MLEVTWDYDDAGDPIVLVLLNGMVVLRLTNDGATTLRDQLVDLLNEGS